MTAEELMKNFEKIAEQIEGLVETDPDAALTYIHRTQAALDKIYEMAKKEQCDI